MTADTRASWKTLVRSCGEEEVVMLWSGQRGATIGLGEGTALALTSYLLFQFVKPRALKSLQRLLRLIDHGLILWRPFNGVEHALPDT